MRQASLRGQVGSIAAREFALQQAPFIAAALALGFLCAYLQHGFVPGGDQAYPLAQVRVPVWHVIWMGVWTGYTMALVGQAAGIFALPYTTSVLQFSNAHVTPSTLLLTFLNPFGALLGSLVIGTFVELWAWVFPNVVELKTVGALAALIVVLLVRPQGILGRKERLG